MKNENQQITPLMLSLELKGVKSDIFSVRPKSEKRDLEG